MQLKDFVGITAGLEPAEVAAMVRLADAYWDARRAGKPGLQITDVPVSDSEFLIELFDFDSAAGCYVHRRIEQLLLRDAAPQLSGFDRFWSLYPRKVAKADAAKKWKAKVKTEALAQRVISALQVHIVAHQWNDKSRLQYVPHPATWLSQERWEDQLETTTSSASMVDA